ncbi:MAG: hypothetical protein GXX89_09245 [Clostridiales bacterium]|nr:hypothetical protein [Clostridiales bacterium]
MLEELRKELAELSGKLERLRKIDSMLKSLGEEERELRERERELRTAFSKESADVERLEKTTLTSILYTILGKKDEKLDAEQREAAAARLKYDAAVRQLDDCRARIDALRAEKETLSGVSRRYNEVFSQIRSELKHDPDCGDRVCELERRLGEAVSQLREVDEAVSAGGACMRQIDMIDEKLGRAQGWGTWDMLGGGLISDLAKHSNLDEAQAGAEYLQTLLSRFRTELADVRISAQTGQVNVEGFLRFADYFFDGLIADWTVLSRIHKSRESVSRVRSQVSDALSRLRFIRAARENEKAALEKELAALVRGV